MSVINAAGEPAPHDMQEFADLIAELNRQINERIWAIGCANNLDLGQSAIAAREMRSYESS